MLVISHPWQVDNALPVSQALRRLRVVAKAQDFVCVGDVDLIVVEGNPKRQVHAIGKHIAPLGPSPPLPVA